MSKANIMINVKGLGGDPDMRDDRAETSLLITADWISNKQMRLHDRNCHSQGQEKTQDDTIGSKRFVVIVILEIQEAN